MKALDDLSHERGLKVGIHLCASRMTCAGYPRSLGGNEYQDDAPVRDVWDREDVGSTKEFYRKQPEFHDVAFLQWEKLSK
jgi:hypothetical protein